MSDHLPRVDDVIRFSPFPRFAGQVLARVEKVDGERGRAFVNTATAGKPQPVSFRDWVAIAELVLGCSICGFFDGEHDPECANGYDDEPMRISCSQCGQPTTRDTTYGDLCYRCIRADNE